MNETSMTIQITVLFFATLREKAGVPTVEISIPDGSQVKDFKQIIRNEFPNLLAHIDSALVSIDREFAFDEDLIPDGAEVALFPPVSGGAQKPTLLIKITEEELDLNSILESVTYASTGAACIFTGMVRSVTERSQPHQTVYLEYEAYHRMATEKMEQIGEEIRLRWPEVEGISIVQRIGRLYPGTPTVVIACTSEHRDSGVFEAARYGIDRLKEIVPIWKKEVGPDNEVWVEGEHQPQPGE